LNIKKSIILVFLLGIICSGWISAPVVRAASCAEKKGRIEIGSLRSNLLPLPMEYRVYLPPCYDEQVEQRYPVLYLVHGQNYTDDQWDRMGADETADRLIAAGEAPPFMIVMPRDRNWDQPTVDKFGQAVVEELIPWIDQSYRTIQDRRYRSIGGLSRGGGWAIHLGLSHQELFGALGGHSPAVFWADTTKIRGWLEQISPLSTLRIYLDIGDKDRPAIMASVVWFEKLLTDKHIPHEWYLFTGYHEEPYWQRNMERYLRWYTRAWK
jgi:enterochelin esterase-like enzyme